MILRRSGGRRTRRGGFSIMLVIIALMVVGTGVTAMAIMFDVDARRTRGALAGGELRQLLMAGEATGREEVALRGTGTREVKVSTPVEGAAVRVNVAGTGEAAELVVVAEYKGMRAQQRVRMVREGAGGAWKVTEARLEQMPIQ